MHIGVMDKVSRIHPDTAEASRPGSCRGRVEIEFRDQFRTLEAVALSRNMTVAALVRTVLSNWLEEHVAAGGGRGAMSTAPCDPAKPSRSEPLVRVYLTMAAGHVAQLARAARAAEVSRNLYVARLLDAIPPPPVPADHSKNRAELMRSTATLAAMSTDLLAFMRMLRQSSSAAQADEHATVVLLSETVRAHLAAVAPLLSALAVSWHPAGDDPH